MPEEKPEGKKEEKKGEKEAEPQKQHHCTVCGKLSPATICHACEDRIRGEALEHKRDREKH